MTPLEFTPWLKEAVWGSESWQLSGVEGHESVVSSGPFAGRDIVSLLKEYKGRLVGSHVYDKEGDIFPLLIKFIDAKADLSIQVHPDDALAKRRAGPSAKGKTEMWYVVKTAPGASLLSGLKKAISPEEYVQRVEDNTITEVLAKYEVHPGDVFYLPAGRIHAIGAGTFLAEIQQTSDITYRIYDYGRPGLDGKPRELHTDLAKDAIDYSVLDDYRTYYDDNRNGVTSLVQSPYFITDKIELSSSADYSLDLRDMDSFKVLIGISGEAAVTDYEPEGDYTIELSSGRTIFIPASSRGVSIIRKGDIPVRIITSNMP